MTLSLRSVLSMCFCYIFQRASRLLLQREGKLDLVVVFWANLCTSILFSGSEYCYVIMQDSVVCKYKLDLDADSVSFVYKSWKSSNFMEILFNWSWKPGSKRWCWLAFSTSWVLVVSNWRFLIYLCKVFIHKNLQVLIALIIWCSFGPSPITGSLWEVLCSARRCETGLASTTERVPEIKREVKRIYALWYCD